MPLVIDTNRAGDFTKPFNGHAKEILLRVKSKRITIAVGGKLYKELSSTKLIDLLLALQSAGRLKRLNDEDCDRLTAELENNELLRSDDPHVVANVIISNAELTYTEDQLLMADLRNRSILRHKTKILTLRTPVRRARPLLDAC